MNVKCYLQVATNYIWVHTLYVAWIYYTSFHELLTSLILYTSCKPEGRSV